MLGRLRREEDPVGWSVGVSEWLGGESLDAPMARADRYLYGVKSAQRGAGAALAAGAESAESAESEYISSTALLPSI